MVNKKLRMNIQSLIFILLIFCMNQVFAEPCGDVNSDGTIDIVDALLIVRYYVGLDPPNFDLDAAEVSGDYNINVVDALLVARFYVGLIDSLPGCPELTPVPTPEPVYNPEGISIEEVAQKWQIHLTIAKEFIQSQVVAGDVDVWLNLQIAGKAYPQYNPAMSRENPAYLEFKLVDMNDFSDKGYILVSLTENDSPVVEFSTEGKTPTENFCIKAETDRDIKIFRFTDAYSTAENNNGELLVSSGTQPLRYPDDALSYLDLDFEVTIDETTGEPQDPVVPDLKLEPYNDYQSFKNDYLSSGLYTYMREHQAKRSDLEWDIYLEREREIISLELDTTTTLFANRKVLNCSLDDPELADLENLDSGILISTLDPGATGLFVRFTEGEEYFVINIIDPANNGEPGTRGWTSWTYYWAGGWGNQPRYGQESCCGCKTGCGAVAWGMLYGWWDRRGYADLIDGIAPHYGLNNNVRDCILAVRNHIETFCIGGSGATWPKNMYKGYKWARDRHRGYSISCRYSFLPCFYYTKARNKAKDCIKNYHRPAIIGIGCTSAHYCLTYAYAYRKYKWLGITLKTSRWFLVNMGHFSSSPVWKEAKVWYGQSSRFW